MDSPETRNSLLVRIRDPEDRDAWYEFCEIYRPVVVRVARVKGLQMADADDLAQQVFMAVAGAISRWQPGGKARFRTWLRRITDNAILNAISRAKPDQAIGGDLHKLLLNHQPKNSGPDSDLLRIEFRREVFAWAARQLRDEFTESTWQAFWMTAVQDVTIDEAVKQLGRTRGAIYAARCRVIMSPEQARGEPVDARSDLFSLGSVMYTMCTARLPFRAESPYGVLRRISDSQPRPIRELNPGIPEWLAVVVDRLHRKSSSDRYESATKVAELLQTCLAHTQNSNTQLPDELTLATRRPIGPGSLILRNLGMLLAISLVAVSVWLMFASISSPKSDHRPILTKEQSASEDPLLRWDGGLDPSEIEADTQRLLRQTQFPFQPKTTSENL